MYFPLTAETTLVYETLLVLSFILLLGMYAGKLFDRLHLPHITGYIFIGTLFGIVLVTLDIEHHVSELSVVSSVALGFIAFNIGSELEFGKLKKSGKTVVVITVTQAIMAALFTIFGVYVIGTSLPISLVLGAIATATAPAPIMLIVRKYKAKGPLTDMLLPLVGMDDAVGVVLFGVLLAVANSLNTGEHLSLLAVLYQPFIELLGSLIVGIVVGLTISWLIKMVRDKDSDKEELFLDISIFAVLITVAVSKMGITVFGLHIELSPILTPMIMGIVLTNNVSRVRSHDVILSLEQFTSPILIAFFTLAGAELVVAFANNQTIALKSLFWLTTAYIIFRMIGKIVGAYAGAKLMNAHRNVKKYLGLCLLPQTGVALGMAYQAKTDFGDSGMIILIVVLVATLVYAMLGPIVVMWSLEKAGEIHRESTYHYEK